MFAVPITTTIIIIDVGMEGWGDHCLVHETQYASSLDTPSDDQSHLGGKGGGGVVIGIYMGHPLAT